MDMVERVARAIGAGSFENKEMEDEEWPLWRSEAIAVIEAMREPTPDMTWAAFEQALVPVMDFKPAWYAAIDSILKSTRETP